jgi:hypothetical protein
MRFIALPFALAVIAASPAASQEEEHYQLQRTDDGYVRMDTRTGEMTRCQENGSELTCRPAAEDRGDERGNETRDENSDQDQARLQDEAGSQEELERLRDLVEALQERVEALEAAKPVAVLPTEREFERTMDFAERFLRRFMGIAKELEDTQDGSNKPLPDRT